MSEKPTLIEALVAAEGYLRDSLAPCDPDCTCVLHIVQAALAAPSASGEGERQDAPFGHENTSDDPALAKAVAEYALGQMGMPDIAVDQEQNWIAGHLFTFAYRREAALRSALTALVGAIKKEADQARKFDAPLGGKAIGRGIAGVLDNCALRIASALASPGDAGTGAEAGKTDSTK